MTNPTNAWLTLVLELNEYLGSLATDSLEQIREDLPPKLIRATALLQQQASELSSLQPKSRIPVISILQKPWEHTNWCDETGRCWFTNSYSLGYWRHSLPPDVSQEGWESASDYTHCAPHWAILRVLPQKTTTEPERYPLDWTVNLTDPKEVPRCSFESKS
jgi:hypothetical protein